MTNTNPDEQIDAAHIETLVGLFSADGAQFTMKDVVDHLQALLPVPKPRTLADMTEDEREACQWMQADFTETEYWHVITAVAGEKSWLLRQEDGSSFEVQNSQITPLPDLPRLEWPTGVPVTSEPSMDAPATINDGNNDAPHPEGVPDGYWLITHPHEVDPVPAEKVGGQWWIVGRGGMLPAAEIAEITLLHRLVPEGKA